MTPAQSSPLDSSITVKVIETIATQEGADPLELEPPLFSAIDTTALNNLFTDTNDTLRAGHVTFSYHGYTVSVSVSEREEVTIKASDTHPDSPMKYCQHCDWSVSAADGSTQRDQSKAAIEHHIETGHPINSTESPFQPRSPPPLPSRGLTRLGD